MADVQIVAGSELKGLKNAPGPKPASQNPFLTHLQNLSKNGPFGVNIGKDRKQARGVALTLHRGAKSLGLTVVVETKIASNGDFVLAVRHATESESLVMAQKAETARAIKAKKDAAKTKAA